MGLDREVGSAADIGADAGPAWLEDSLGRAEGPRVGAKLPLSGAPQIKSKFKKIKTAETKRRRRGAGLARCDAAYIPPLLRTEHEPPNIITF